MSKIAVTVELPDAEVALALAQFVKRVSLATCEEHSDPTKAGEAAAMLDGLAAVRRGLDEVGYSPR